MPGSLSERQEVRVCRESAGGGFVDPGTFGAIWCCAGRGSVRKGPALVWGRPLAVVLVARPALFASARESRRHHPGAVGELQGQEEECIQGWAQNEYRGTALSSVT